MAATPAAAADFDARGVLRFSPEAVFQESFEDPDAMAALGVQLLGPNFDVRDSDAVALTNQLWAGPEVLEGLFCLRVMRMGFRDNGPAHVRVPLPPVDGTLEVRAWTRAAGQVVTLWALYGDTDHLSFAAVAGVPTGRETSDGWVELTTGPLEPDVMGRPLTHVMFSGESNDLWVDGLEVLRTGPRRVPASAPCTAFNEDTVCGIHGECILGMCVDSAVVWGAVPATPERRREYVDRVAFIFERMHANREAVNNRGAETLARLRGLAMTDSARLFHGGVTRAINFFKDGHTSGPMAYAGFFSSVPSSFGRQSSGALGACVGLTELDIRAGGGTGYTVFRAGGDGVAPELRVGDILWRVDRVGLRGWMEHMYELAGMGSDPASDAAFWATELPGLLSARASVVDFLRCESATSCAQPTLISIPVADRIRERMGDHGHLFTAFQQSSCDGRFSNAVSELRDPDPNGNDVVTWEVQGDITALQFDGVVGEEAYDNDIDAALASGPSKFLFDTRLGNGGYITTVAHMVSRLRDSTDPMSAFGLHRPWHEMDPAGLYDELLPCMDDDAYVFMGGCSTTITFETSSTPATAAGARVAWLHTQDISGNDYAPMMLKGRDHFRIFGPVNTAGAFGAVVQVPPLLPGEYSGGSIQVHDTRFAPTRDALKTATYASGYGVPPDEVVVQKLSDSLNGTDTLVTRARAWLMEAP